MWAVFNAPLVVVDVSGAGLPLLTTNGLELGGDIVGEARVHGDVQLPSVSFAMGAGDRRREEGWGSGNFRAKLHKTQFSPFYGGDSTELRTVRVGTRSVSNFSTTSDGDGATRSALEDDDALTRNGATNTRTDERVRNQS